jgi:ADP-heptose:LPS heptosyltransferase
MSNRSKAFFINGGAGRVLCSIPALEKYAEESGDDDFVIVCEGGMEFYRGHPELHKRAYESWHKGLFENHLKDKYIVSPEPYRVNEYMNQKCDLAQAFDIIINELDESREVQDPIIKLNKSEMIQGYQTIQEMKADIGKNKVLVVQPFGRSISKVGDFLVDSTSRSFELQNIINIIEKLRTEYIVVVMTEHQINFETLPEHPIAVPQIQDMRIWASIINSADHFLGCDSVGQHIAKALGKTATVVTGSTFPENISYPGWDDFDIIDIGKDKGRVYSPIRISMDDERDRANDEVMMMDDEQEQSVVDSVKLFMGESEKFEGSFTPAEENKGCCGTIPASDGMPEYKFNTQNLLGEL